MKNISQRISRYLGKEQNLEQSKVEVIRFGIETFLNMVIGYLAIFLIAYLIGSLKAVIIICLVNFFMRSFSGGGHCSSWQRCTVAGALTVPLVAWISEKVIISPQTLPLYWWGGSLFIFLLIYKYAPKDNPTKPIVTNVHRQRLKILSLGFVLLMLFSSLFLSSLLSSIIFYALTWQTLSIMPLGTLAIDYIDRGLQKVGI